MKPRKRNSTSKRKRVPPSIFKTQVTPLPGGLATLRGLADSAAQLARILAEIERGASVAGSDAGIAKGREYRDRLLAGVARMRTLLGPPRKGNSYAETAPICPTCGTPRRFGKPEDVALQGIFLGQLLTHARWDQAVAALGRKQRNRQKAPQLFTDAQLRAALEQSPAPTTFALVAANLPGKRHRTTVARRMAQLRLKLPPKDGAR